MRVPVAQSSGHYDLVSMLLLWKMTISSSKCSREPFWPSSRPNSTRSTGKLTRKKKKCLPLNPFRKRSRVSLRQTQPPGFPLLQHRVATVVVKISPRMTSQPTHHVLSVPGFRATCVENAPSHIQILTACGCAKPITTNATKNPKLFDAFSTLFGLFSCNFLYICLSEPFCF